MLLFGKRGKIRREPWPGRAIRTALPSGCEGTAWWVPENDAYQPIDGSEAQILGIVKGLVRLYN